MGGCQTGQAKITGGYNLSARYVIHTVGPVWFGGGQNEPDLLASCYRQSLKLAVQHQLKTIAFPAISCGVYRFPVDKAADIAISEVQDFLGNNAGIEKVLLVCFEAQVFRAYSKAFQSKVV